MAKPVKHKYCGKCIFCCSKCPECGSTKVDINFMPKYRYSNRKPDFINVKFWKLHIELKCKSCGASFDETHKRMKTLAKWLAEHGFFRIGVYYIQVSPSGGKIKMSPIAPHLAYAEAERSGAK